MEVTRVGSSGAGVFVCFLPHQRRFLPIVAIVAKRTIPNLETAMVL